MCLTLNCGFLCVQCNNPLTKEAKLTAAVRILPEWRGYDNEIRELQKKIDSGVLDPESNENDETIGELNELNLKI